MEKGEINYDEIFDLKPIFPEIGSNIDRSIKPQISDNRRTSSPKTNHLNYYSNSNMNNNSPICSWNSSSDSSTVLSKLISFESSNSTDRSNLETINFSSASASVSASGNYKDDDCICSSNEDQYNPQRIRINNSAAAAAATATATRTPSQAQEHVVAERKRRENLSQLFISLSKVVPGLKKLDKASLLEDGIKYVKDLEERVRVLEEEEERRRSMDAVARVDHSSSSSYTYESDECPEIEARISEKLDVVLIKIICKNNNKMGLMSRIASELLEMHLNVVDMRIMPFGVGVGVGVASSLHITILAQIQSEFEGAVKDIVDHLRTLFSN